MLENERGTEHSKVFFGHWHIGEVISKKRSGVRVYQLLDASGRETSKILKIIPLFPENTITAGENLSKYVEQIKECTERQLQIVNRLRGNANIVGYLDYSFEPVSDGTALLGYRLLIMMERFQVMRQKLQQALPAPAEVVRLGEHMCCALVQCECMKIIHRDIKPENIFVDADNTYRLGDFGIAKVLDDLQMTSTRTGTGAYAAPEQWLGKRYSYSVDLYSTGLVLYELLNEGCLPLSQSRFVQRSDVERRIRGEVFPPPAHGSEALKAIVMKACAFRPEDRYASAQEMLEALRSLPKEQE